MILKVNDYIQKNAGSWPLKASIGSKPAPLLFFNKSANGLVNTEEIGIITLWFNGKDACPCLVSKIMDRSCPIEFIKDCAVQQQKINKEIGRDVFPLIYHIAMIDDHPVVFQEPVNGMNYEMELYEAIHSSRGSLALLKETMVNHFKEMGWLLASLRKINTGTGLSQVWGDWAYRQGSDFKNNHGIELNFITGDVLDKIKDELNLMPLQQHYVLADHFCANFFKGPVLVDQIDINLRRRSKEEPGALDAVLFIITYFRTSPVTSVYKDWVELLACAVKGENISHEIIAAVRGLLTGLGFDLNNPRQIWSLFMTAFFVRAIDELTFHQNNIFDLDQLRFDLKEISKKLVETQARIYNNQTCDFLKIINAEKAFIPKSNAHVSHIDEQMPYLIEEGYRGFNIVFYRKKYYAAHQSMGVTDFTQTDNQVFLDYQKNDLCFIDISLEKIKHLVDEFNLKKLDAQIQDYRKTIETLRSIKNV